jgi:hypothetical protein
MDAFSKPFQVKLSYPRWFFSFASENRYWCHQKKGYVNPEESICEKFMPKLKGPLDKYI